MKRLISVFIAILAVVQLSLCTPAASAAPYEDARGSIIRILTKWGDSYMTTGTGFFIGKEGDSVQYIVTNSHVIHFEDSGYIYDPTSLEVIFDGIDNQTTLEATVVKDWKYWENGQPDLAIIKLVAETTLRKSLPLMPAEQLGLTETIYALGFPYIADYDTLNLPSRIEDVTVSKGSVTKQLYQGINGDVRYLQMDAVISGGNSGGPVITEEGYAAGISSYGSTVTSGFNYALYMEYIIDFLDTMGIPYDKVEDRSAGGPSAGGTDPGQTGADPGQTGGTAGGTDVAPTTAPAAPPVSESKGLFASLPGWALIAVIAVLAAVVIAVILLLVLSKKKTAPPPMPAQPVMPPPPVQRTIPVAPASQPAPSGPAIIGIAGEMNGKTFPISGTIAIGRDPARCAVAFAASTPGISSEHCRLKAVQGGVILVDVGSTYGTFFENGSKLTTHQEYTLHSGDKFYLGSKDNGFRVV
jgi:S1-C subfamily serine protease